MSMLINKSSENSMITLVNSEKFVKVWLNPFIYKKKFVSFKEHLSDIS